MDDDIADLEDLGPLEGKSVLVRADLNVPLRPGESGTPEIADDFRITESLPTIRWLVDRGARVTVASHLGRPKGRIVPELAMAPVRRRLSELVPGVQVLENLRFDPGEEANDPAFGARLVEGHDLYVNDAFGTCHRAHASVMYPPTVLPSAAGRLLRAELDALDAIMSGPPRPFTVVAGGAKVKDKIGTLRALAASADRLVIGGAMALTFLAAQSRGVGSGTVEADQLEACRVLLGSGIAVDLPSDLLATPVVAGGGSRPAAPEVRSFFDDVPEGWLPLDIGPDTSTRFRQEIERSASVLWNGPMGVFEEPAFAEGTREIALAVAACPGFTVVGGGDTVSAVRAMGLAGSFGHLSTGGGAMLELVQNGDLPGLAALRQGNPRHSRPPGAPAEGAVGTQAV